MKRAIRKLIQIPYAFVLLNWAAVAGLYYFTRGHESFWNPVALPPRQREGLRQA